MSSNQTNDCDARTHHCRRESVSSRAVGPRSRSPCCATDLACSNQPPSACECGEARTQTPAVGRISLRPAPPAISDDSDTAFVRGRPVPSPGDDREGLGRSTRLSTLAGSRAIGCARARSGSPASGPRDRRSGHGVRGRCGGCRETLHRARSEVRPLRPTRPDRVPLRPLQSFAGSFFPPAGYVSGASTTPVMEPSWRGSASYGRESNRCAGSAASSKPEATERSLATRHALCRRPNVQ